MAAILVDANILVRLFDARSADSPKCAVATERATQRRGEFFICAQSAIEFWVVATRPISVNGLGLSPAEADAALSKLDRFLVMLPELGDVALRWRHLVRAYNVSGRPAHDARLVALMEAHGVRDLLSLNARDFARYPSVRIASPQDVLDGKV
jgi:predicted nucleic acid-binding protein